MDRRVQVRDAWQALLDFFYPGRCLGCRASLDFGWERAHGAGGLREEQQAFCAGCRGSLFRLETGVCRICGHPQEAAQGQSCEACRRYPPRYRKAWSLYAYAGALREALHHFKYRDDRVAGRLLCALFAARAPELGIDWQRYRWALPVPLHIRRMRQRGFQQAWWLLRALELPQGLEVRPFLLQRNKPTASQAGLDKQERRRNLQQAIEVSARAPRLDGGHVLLIDDVLTTGATADACATALLRRGAKSVDVLTLCRAVL